ncbi:predicted protein [Postia placenta Mad-698-R]|nr:predicted protein [Postia placenta Mad-698-R]
MSTGVGQCTGINEQPNTLRHGVPYTDCLDATRRQWSATQPYISNLPVRGPLCTVERKWIALIKSVLMVNPYAPDESHHDLVAETEWLQGAMLSGILYGVEVTLFIICFKLLVQQMRRENYKRQCILLAFITTVFTLGTLLMYSIADMTQLSFINDRNFPGGPAAYEVQMYWIPVDEVGVVAMVVGNWFMDALLTSRSSPFNSVDFTVPYFATTLALNIVVTILIVSRLLYHRWRLGRALGPAYVSHYTYLAAILAESAAFYSVFSILFLVPLVLNNPLSSVFLQALSQSQTVASLVIIYYVASGKTWTETISTQATSVTRQRSNTIQFRDLQTSSSRSEHECDLPKVDITVVREVVTDGERASVLND